MVIPLDCPGTEEGCRLFRTFRRRKQPFTAWKKVVCPNCHTEIPSDDVFCSRCGARVSGDGFWNSFRFRHSWINRPFDMANRFWNGVTEGMAIHELWAQFRSDTRASYNLFSKDINWEKWEGEPKWKRRWRIGRMFFWAVVMKLSPSRRVLLLIALALFVLALITGHGIAWFFAVIAALALLTLELADRITMKRDLEIAREIQGWLEPKSPPEVPGIDLAFTTRPANTVAGDYYDAFLRPAANGTGPSVLADTAGPGNRLLLIVADVAGKSVPAALLMATLQASLRTLAATPIPFLDMVSRLNDYSCAHSLNGLRYTTAFFAELNPATRTFTYVNAGHNYPLLCRASGGIDRLVTGGLPLGIGPYARYASGSAILYPNDLLVIFTDGVVEAVNDNDEEFGEARLLQLLSTRPFASASDELKRLMGTVDAFVGPTRQHDDITCLILRAR
ncbi:MAG: SpoIIE family protein phosphatase [Acidobacteriota bacterium]|nr:SpoIIE family protein phosphatase [Acidobacteriota bacterium]